MKALEFKKRENCHWDFVGLGEVLLRFDPGEKLIESASSFEVFDGGAEYNVVRNLSNSFSRKSAIVTVLNKDKIGKLIEGKILSGGVDTSLIKWADSENQRNGIYFIERGFGMRAPESCFDRDFTGIASLKTDSIDWKHIFEEKGVSWFTTGGVYAGLSVDSPNVAIEAMKVARESGAIVSFDLNYRDSLWKNRGGIAAANELNKTLIPYADVVIGLMDYKPSFSNFDALDFKRISESLIEENPNVKLVAITMREVISASRHNFKAACYIDGQVLESREYIDVGILDRIGSGDAFSAGLFEGLISGSTLQESIDLGAAAGVLVMTTLGDNLDSTSDQIKNLVAGNYGNVKR